MQTLTLMEKSELKFAKEVYGKEPFDNNKTIQFSDRHIVAWYINGYDTIEELEKAMPDEQIYRIFKNQR